MRPPAVHRSGAELASVRVWLGYREGFRPNADSALPPKIEMLQITCCFPNPKSAGCVFDTGPQAELAAVAEISHIVCDWRLLEPFAAVGQLPI